MPKAFPIDFRNDVVAVARKGEASIAQVAKDFGVFESCLQRWQTREELRLAMMTWIETKYHRKHRQRRLGKLTPIEFETIYMAADAA